MSDFIKACQAATERLFMHRKALRRVGVRLGFWPDGLVLSANITARTNAEMLASIPPITIPWAELATTTEADMISAVDRLCNPLYETLGITRPS